MKNLKHHFDFNKENRNGVLLLTGILFLIQVLILGYEPIISKTKPTKNQLLQIKALQQKLETAVKPEIIYKKFNPNKLGKKGWVSLGFSEKQAHSILKYKASIDSFSTLEEIEQCYVISSEKFSEIKPYITFAKKTKQKSRKEKLALNYFNPNKLSKKEWGSLGFSEKQAEVILKYKKSVGGLFKTKEELKKCFVISDEVFQKISPWIILREQKEKVEVNNRDLNLCDVNGLVAKGISSKEAQRIVNYRNALGGFYSWIQLQEINVLPQRIKKLEDRLVLKIPIKKMNVNKEEFYILKKHPYITRDFLNFLKHSREKVVKFTSFKEIQKQYKKESLNKWLEHYLSY
ncbi:MAG: ComEA family DNA-binding protein [Flavobacteriales bacterium]